MYNEINNIQLLEIKRRDRHILENLMQFYNYDFSEMVDLDIPDTGRYNLNDLGLQNIWRHPYLIKVDGKLAGFAIVDESHPDRDEEDVIDLAEFFIMRKFRKRGIGEAVATTLFKWFPGRWRVRQIAKNSGALAFWRKVIGRYTGNRFQDSTWQEDLYHGTVQYFDSPTHQ